MNERITQPARYKRSRFALVIRFMAMAVLFLATSTGLAMDNDSRDRSVVLPASTDSTIRGGPVVSPETHSVARLWNEQMLAAIRRDTPRPTVHARNLYHVSAAMYDAWAAYSESDLAVFHDEQATADGDTGPAREEAISHAAYRLLSHRFANSPGHGDSQAGFDGLMDLLGFDMENDDTQGQSPAAVGNRVAGTIIKAGLADNSNEASNYQDTTGYNPVNVPMLVILPGTGGLSDPNAWQPLIPPGASGSQQFLGAHWSQVETFALQRPDAGGMYLDPGPPPMLGGQDDEQLKAEILDLIRASERLDPTDGEVLDISPQVTGNNPLGTNDGTGHGINPVTGKPYPPNPVLRGDRNRVLAEFWEDGPMSSTPPGHWNEIANQVTEALDPGQLRITGKGPAVDKLEWDIKLYLALNGASHDSAVATWEVKRHYNASRPITLIRGMAESGQSSNPDLPAYHPDGLPLEPGLVELITKESTAPGEPHEHLAGHIGEIAIFAWQGHPDDPDTEIGGSGWIRGVEWIPYQAVNFVTPPFAGYTSGHSGFSRAAAEVLAGLTGDAFFPGGMGEYVVSTESDFGLRFEFGPQEEVRLQWATYFDAADEAGNSRIHGGIHPQYDDLPGRVMGHMAGIFALEQALAHYAPVGQEPPAPMDPVSVPVAQPWAWTLLILLTGLMVCSRRFTGRFESRT